MKRVVGIDSSPQMLENARAVCQGLACVKIIEGNAAQIPSDDAQFDGLAAIQVYEYVKDVSAALEEARRVFETRMPHSDCFNTGSIVVSMAPKKSLMNK